MAKISWLIVGVLLCAPVTGYAQQEVPPEQEAETAEQNAGPDVEVVVPAGPGTGEASEEGGAEDDAPSAPQEEAPGDPPVSEASPEAAVEAPNEGDSAATQDVDPGAADDDGAAEDDEEGLDFFIDVHGAYRVRANLMDDIPLTALPSRDFDPTLGQRWWVSQWLRVGANIGLRDHAQIITEFDVGRGVLAGDFTNGVEAAARPISSARTQRSRMPRPPPPYISGKATPAQPSSTIPFHKVWEKPSGLASMSRIFSESSSALRKRRAFS